MDLDKSEAILKVQAKEKEYGGMTVLQLVEVAKKENVDTKGDKAALTQRLIDKVSGKTKNADQIFLEEAILTWSMQDMKDYLHTMKKPTWGSKAIMTERIMNYITIDEAVEITREYRTYLATTTATKEMGKTTEDDETTGDKSNVGKSTEVDERKRKREGIEGEKDVETGNDMGINGEEKVEEERVTRKPFTPRRSRVADEEDDIMVTEVVSPVDDNPNPLPQGTGIGGLDHGIDEAGWKTKGGGDNDSVGTTNISNVKRTRIGLMLTVPPSVEPDKQLCRVAQQWFKKMKESDSRFTLVPWKVEDASKPMIRLEKNIPNLMTKIRMYFSRVQAKSDGGKVYTDVFVQHSIPIADLRGDAEWFLREKGMGMYDKDLQVESVERKGWLLYSTPALDARLLAEKIGEELGIAVALRWKYINTDKFEQLDKNARKKWMALHIEVASDDGKKASRGLARLYGSKSQAFPLGIRMRLVSEFREVKGNTVMMGKHTRLRVRQSSFLSMTIGHPADDIMLLDFIPKGQKASLRNLIMGIQSQNVDTPGNLFHAVGKDWKGRIVLNYLELKKNEAAMIADGLIPFLQYHYGDEVYEFFDPEAVVEKDDWYWDDAKKTIVNPLSTELDGLEAVDNDYDFSVAHQEENQKIDATIVGETPKTASELAAARLNLVVTGGDGDSVSTLGNPLSPARIRQQVISSLLPAAPGVSWGDSASVQSSATMDTRLSAMEQTMQTLAVDMEKKFEDSMNKFFNRMQSANQANVQEQQPPGGASAGEHND